MKKKTDCWTVVRQYYETHGMHLPFEYLSVFADKTPKEIHEVIEGKKRLFKKLSSPEPFALVTFYSTPPYVSHIGVVNHDGTRVIHYSKRYGIVTTPIHRLTAIEGFYKFEPELG